MKLARLKELLVYQSFWAGAGAVLMLVPAVFLLYTLVPVDGYRKAGSHATSLVVTDPMIPQASGLKAGDKILSIDGASLGNRPIPTPREVLAVVKSQQPSARYEVGRNGQVVSVIVPLHHIGWARLLLIGGAHFLLPAFFVVLASILYVRSGPALSYAASSFPKYRSVRIVCYTLVCGAANLISVSELSVRSGAEWLRLFGLLTPLTFGLVFGLLLHFFLIFPPRPRASSGRWSIYSAHATHLSLSLGATSFALTGASEPWVLMKSRVALAGVFIITAALVAFRSYRRLASPIQRNQMRWLGWGTVVGIGPWFCFYLLFVLVGLRPLIDYRLVILWIAVIPISLLVAISRYRLLEIDGLIRRSLVYTVLMAAMTGLYLCAVVVSTGLMQARSSETRPVAVAMVTVLLLALAFNPLKRLSERLVERTFYRGAVDPREAFSKFTLATSRVMHLAELAEVLTQGVPRAFMASGAALIVMDDEGQRRVFATSRSLRESLAANSSELASYVQSRPDRWPEVLYPVVQDNETDKAALPPEMALCFPMSVAGRLAGLYLLGKKLSNRLYSRDELDTLRALGHHVATALDNACAYQRLNRLNAGLERIVELRTKQLQQANGELAAKNDVLVQQNSELERLIEQLRETQAALLEAERLAAIGEIVITVCHEINNPLSAIAGQAQLIQMQLEGVPEKVIEKVRVIDQCAEKIREITEKMRHLEGTKTVTYVGHMKMIDLNQSSGVAGDKDTQLESKKESASGAA